MSNKLISFYFRLFHFFDHTACDVDFQKRLGAYVIDWIVGGILTGLPAVLLYGAITGRNDMFSDLYVFETLGFTRFHALLAGLLCIVCALFYYVYVPLKIYKGQTLGKHIVGFKIVKLNDEDVDLKTLCIRQVLGMFLLEGAVLIVSNYIRQLTSLSLNYYVDYYWAIAGMIITFISILIVLKTPSHRAIHDYLAKTKLIVIKDKDSSKEEPTSHKNMTKKNVTKKNMSKNRK